MTIRPATNRRPGIKLFYVDSESGNQYAVQFIRRSGMRRVQCNCPDFTFRGSTRRSHRYCKHIKAIIAARTAVAVKPLEFTLAAQLSASIELFRNPKHGGR